MSLTPTVASDLKKVFDDCDGLTRERIPRAARKSMNAGLQEIVKGARSEVPKVKSRGRGHSRRSTQNAIGKKVRRKRDGEYDGKAGVGVGKPRGSVPKHIAANVAGTEDRHTGRTQIRKKGKVVGHTQTGNSRKFRGRVVESDVVSKGAANAAGAASQKMVEVAQRELATEANGWERANGIK